MTKSGVPEQQQQKKAARVTAEICSKEKRMHRGKAHETRNRKGQFQKKGGLGEREKFFRSPESICCLAERASPLRTSKLSFQGRSSQPRGDLRHKHKVGLRTHPRRLAQRR